MLEALPDRHGEGGRVLFLVAAEHELFENNLFGQRGDSLVHLSTIWAVSRKAVARKTGAEATAI